MKNRLLAGLIPVLLLMPMLATAQALPTIKPELKQVIFVHYWSQTPPPWVLDQWDETEDDFRLIAGGVKWYETISYKVNYLGSGLNESAVLSAMTSASEEWDNWVGTSVIENKAGNAKGNLYQTNLSLDDMATALRDAGYIVKGPYS